MKKVLFLGLISLNAMFALDINEAVNLALTNNHGLKQEKFSYEETKENEVIARAGFLPKVNASYTYEYRDRTITNQLRKASTLSGTVSYNLFSGFSDLFSYKSAKYTTQYSKLMYEGAKYDLVLDTQTAYVNYLEAKASLLTQLDAYKLFKKQYEDASNKFDQGLIAKNDLLQVEVQMLQSKQAIEEAKQAVEVARITLSNVIVNDVDESTIVEDLDISENNSFDNFLYEDRNEVKAMNLLVDSYEAYKKGLNGAFMPSVDVYHTYIEYGDSMEVDGALGYPDSQNLSGIEVSWNLFNGGIDQANKVIYQKRISSALESLEELKQQIALQYKNAKLQLEVSKLNLESAKLSLKQAELNYEIVNNRFGEGISTSTDLSDANYLLTQAKESYNTAYYNRYLAIVTLQRITQSYEVNSF